MGLHVKIWGARGSHPAPKTPIEIRNRLKQMLVQFLEDGNKDKSDIDGFINSLPPHEPGGFGGNTICIEVDSDEQKLIVDGGSGCRLLGYDLLKGSCGQGKGEIHMLFTHLHWDHLLGLPFFTPIFIPGNTIHVYAVQEQLEEAFNIIFKKPFFPVEIDQLGSKIVYHQLKPRETVEFNDIKVTPYQLDHPDPCWGFKFESGGKVLSHCVDTECLRTSQEELGDDLPLYQDVDVMLIDAQYTLSESLEKVNWGHASATHGLEIAMREGIKKVLFMHHDPASSTEKVIEAISETDRYYITHLKMSKLAGVDVNEVDWSFAHEGLEFDV